MPRQWISRRFTEDAGHSTWCIRAIMHSRMSIVHRTLFDDSEGPGAIRQDGAGRSAAVGAAVVIADMAGLAAEVAAVVEHGPGGVGTAGFLDQGGCAVAAARAAARVRQAARHVVLAGAQRRRRAARPERRHRHPAVYLPPQQTRSIPPDRPARGVVVLCQRQERHRPVDEQAEARVLGVYACARVCM